MEPPFTVIMNTFKTTTLALVAAAAWTAQATISLSLDVEGITSTGGAALPNSGVAVLVVSTTDSTFDLPGVAGDDKVIAIWDLTKNNVVGDAFSLLVQSVEYGNGVDENDPLGIFWYPNVAYDGDNLNLGANEPYGFFSDTTEQGLGDSWVMPADGTLLHSLKFFTANADDLVAGGNIPELIGQALFEMGETFGQTSAASAVGVSESSPGTVGVSWTGGSAYKGKLIVQRRLVGDAFWESVGTVDNGMESFDDDSIGRGKEYEYRVIAFNGFGSEPSPVIEASKTLRSNLINISTRGLMGIGKNSLIAGYVAFGGSGKVELVTRTLGQSLARTGDLDSDQVMTDPFSILVGGGLNVLNLDWDDDGQEPPQPDPTIAANMNTLFDHVGAYRLEAGETDSAQTAEIVADTVYTIISAGFDIPERIGLVEVFDQLNSDDSNEIQDSTERLINLSTRGLIGPPAADQAMIGGFTVVGKSSMRLLIRGVSHTIIPAADPEDIEAGDLLPNPQIWLLNQRTNVVLQKNDSWKSKIDDSGAFVEDQTAEITEATLEAGAFPFVSDTEAAMVVELSPDPYTVIYFDSSGQTGIGLFELYELGL